MNITRCWQIFFPYIAFEMNEIIMSEKVFSTRQIEKLIRDDDPSLKFVGKKNIEVKWTWIFPPDLYQWSSTTICVLQQMQSISVLLFIEWYR